MSTTKTTGRYYWRDLLSPDPKAAIAFYGELFGWKTRTLETAMGAYTVFSVGDRDGDREVAGAMSAEASKGIPAHWNHYFTTTNLDAGVNEIERLGGKVIRKPQEIPGGGRFAILADAQHAAFGLLAPKEERAETEGLPTPGAFCWVELHTDDPAAGLAFYKRLFRWTSKEHSFGGAPYYEALREAGKDAAGITGKLMSGPNAWLGYVAVDDVDAKVKRAETLRGKVLAPPADIPDIGRFAVVEDPTGAVVAMIKGIPRTK